MKTNSRTTIIGSLEDVYRLVEDVGRWPEIAESVGDVKILSMEGREKTVEMAARGGILSLTMTCVQETAPSERLILFRYTKGLMKGVEAEWTFSECQLRKNLVLVNVAHDFKNVSPVRAYILSRFFLQSQTELMLKRLKEIVEAGFMAKVLLFGADFAEQMDWSSDAMLESQPVMVKVY